MHASHDDDGLHGMTSGLSGKGLARLDDGLGRLVEDGALPGLSALVWQRGEVARVVTHGMADVAAGKPVARDTIFRIASMTKPVVSVATLVLMEEGRLALDEPISRYLPEASDLRVLRAPAAELHDTEALLRPPTLHDLLTHQAGFTGPLGPASPLGGAYGEATGHTPFFQFTPDELVARVCALPLIQQPGRLWHYGVSTDLLGVVVARAAGQSLGELLHDRIFKPLGMVDTGFHADAAQQRRMAIGYARDPKGALQVHDAPTTGLWSRPPLFEAGGIGLLSTLDDYLAFALMLLKGGAAGGRRILSRPSVELMTAPHLRPGQAEPLVPTMDILQGRNFGLGVSVLTGATMTPGSPGKYGWPGAYGTDWFNDPREELIGIVLSQVWYGGGVLRSKFNNLVYQAIED